MARRAAYETRGYLLAVCSAAFLSTTSIFIRYLTQSYQVLPLVLALWRDIFVFLTLLPILFWVKGGLWRVPRRHLPYLVGYGAVLAVFNAFWTLSVAINGAAVATVLVYCSAGFTAILGWWLLKERMSWGKAVAVLVSLAGCGYVSGAFLPGAWQVNGHGVLAGVVTGVIAGLCYALYSLLGRSASQRGLNPWSSLLYTFGFASLFLLAINLVGGGRIPGTAAALNGYFSLGQAWQGWGILFLLAAVPTLAGFGLYNVSLTYLPSSVVNLIATLEPAFTTVTAFLVLGETLTATQVVGSLMTVGGVVLLRVYEGWLAPEAEPGRV